MCMHTLYSHRQLFSIPASYFKGLEVSFPIREMFQMLFHKLIKVHCTQYYPVLARQNNISMVTSNLVVLKRQ